MIALPKLGAGTKGDREGPPSPRLADASEQSASRPETSSYLGFRVTLLDERDLTIHAPDGHLIFTGRMSFSTARNVIRGYRKEDS